jgi:hypothetical protein
LSIPVFLFLLPSIFILNFFLRECDFSLVSREKNGFLKGRSVNVSF